MLSSQIRRLTFLFVVLACAVVADAQSRLRVAPPLADQIVGTQQGRLLEGPGTITDVQTFPQSADSGREPANAGLATAAYILDNVAVVLEYPNVYSVHSPANPEQPLNSQDGYFYTGQILSDLESIVDTTRYHHVLLYSLQELPGWIHSGDRGRGAPAKNIGLYNGDADAPPFYPNWPLLTSAPHMNSIDLAASGTTKTPWTAIHEIAHQWCVFWAHGAPNPWEWTPDMPLAWLGAGDGHWSFVWSDEGLPGLMYSAPTSGLFNAFDLYALGLMGYDEASTYHYDIYEDRNPPVPHVLTLSDLIYSLSIAGAPFYEGDGRRMPDTDAAMTQRNTLIVLIKGQDEELSDQQRLNLHWLYDSLPAAWTVATWGRSSMSLEVVPRPPELMVTPAVNFASLGLTSGPFYPEARTYTLRNTGGEPMDWSVTQSWPAGPFLISDPASGSLAPGESQTVTISLRGPDVYSYTNNTLYGDAIYFNNHNTGIGSTERMVSLFVSDTPWWPTPSDYSDDQRSDILWHHSTSGELWLWPMNGAEKLPETRLATVEDTRWKIRGLGDQTGDGQADVLWRHNASGEIYLWPMSGGTPLDPIYVATVDTAYDIVGTGDFDGDGRSDILWRNQSAGDVWVWLMDGASRVDQVYLDTVEPEYSVKGVGDVDGDLKADIIWYGTAGDVWVWLMEGGTWIEQSLVGAVADTNYRIEAVADFNRDGMMDLLWWNAAQGDVWIWTMNGAAAESETFVGVVPDTNYRIQAAGDYNGDTNADILWRHAIEGDVWVWLMDGTTKVSEGLVGTVSDLGYQIVPQRATTNPAYKLDVTLAQGHHLSGPYAALLTGPNGFTCALRQDQESVSCPAAWFTSGTAVSLLLTITVPEFANSDPFWATAGCDALTVNTCTVMMNTGRSVTIWAGKL